MWQQLATWWRQRQAQAARRLDRDQSYAMHEVPRRPLERRPYRTYTGMWR